MRTTTPTSCAALLLAALAASCDGSDTAITVEFDIVGSRAAEAERLEIRLRCQPLGDRPERISFDLARLGEGLTPSLSIEPGAPACDVIVDAQALGSGPFPLAATSIEADFNDGERDRVTATLDTDACVDVDGDGVAGGRGGAEGCDDCDELDPAISPRSPLEICNGRDDNCDGVVDNFTQEDMQRACPGWSKDNGICRYWAPQCVQGTLFCPVLDQPDDCEGLMDTNCDGQLTDCPCTPALLEQYDQCPPCQVPTCNDEGSGITCVARTGEAEIGTCCEGGAGLWACSEAGDVYCNYEAQPLEVCNDAGGVSEDCDLDANYDDPDCTGLDRLQIVCDPLPLPTAARPDPTGACGEGFSDFYNLDRCGLTGSSSVAQIVLYSSIIWVAPLENIGSAGCCGCEFTSVYPDWGYPQIDVAAAAAQGRIGLDGPRLSMEVDLAVWYYGPAIVERFPVVVDVVPVMEGGLEGEACVAACYVIES
jgi:hypothetical protein